MKKLLIITTLFICLNATAQKVYNDLKGFDKIELRNINGSVDIQLGKDFSIKIDGLNKNDSLVKVYVMPEHKLMISMQKGLSWDMVQKMNLKIKITMPEISKLYNSSNADVTIKNFVGRYLGIENIGNGNVELLGRMIDSLDIKNNGNGDTNAKNIIAKKTNITKSGNGDIIIKTYDNFEASLSGNGDIVNYGTGKAIISKQSGNGRVIYRN